MYASAMKYIFHKFLRSLDSNAITLEWLGKKSVSPDIVPTFDGHLFSITYSKVPFSLYVFFSNFLTSFLDTFSLLWRIPRISHFSGGALMDFCATTKSFVALMNPWVIYHLSDSSGLGLCTKRQVLLTSYARSKHMSTRSTRRQKP